MLYKRIMFLALAHFQVIRPQYESSQAALLEWIAYAHAKGEAVKAGWEEGSELFMRFYEDIKESLFKLGLGKEKIEKRGTVLRDIFHQNWEEMEIYKLATHPEGVDFRQRSHFFDSLSTEIFERFYPSHQEIAPHLIHVTCTGYVAPSPAQKLVSKREAGEKTVVTHAYHMGCYASIPALRMAQGFLRAADLKRKKIDIVHTELCTLHMNPLLHEKEQLVVHSLFADGFIKYSLVPQEEVGEVSSLNVLSVHEVTLPDSSEIMTWKCEHWGMRMTLAKSVPVVIRNGLPSFLKTLIEKAGEDPEETIEKALFAIHPGGTKIIQQIAQILNLRPDQIAHSQQVLAEYGNMSSATLPHIWEKILQDPRCPKGKKILSLAFGPGLSLSGALLEKCGC